MLESTLVAVIGLLIPLLAGYQIVSYLHIVSSGERTALGLITGYAILIFILTWAGAFIGSKSYSWIVFGMIVCSFGMHPNARRQFFSDFAGHLRNPWVVAAGFCAFLLVAFLNIRNYLPGAPLFYESDANHDCLNWIIAADILTNSGYLYPQTSYDAGKFIFPGFAGWWGFDTRLGSELILSWLADLTNARPALIFNAFVASLYFGWVSAIWLLIKRLAGGMTLPAWSLLLVVCTQPAFVFYFRFGNVPNLFGIILAAGWITWGLLGYEHKRLPLWLRIGPPSLGLSATLAAYPEILTFILPAYVVVIGIRSLRIPHQGRIKSLLEHLLSLAILGAAWNPISTIRGIGTVWCKSTYAAKGLPIADLFTNVDPMVIIPAWLTIDRTLEATIGTAPAVIMALSLIIVTVIALKKAPVRELGLLGLLIAIPLLIIAETRDLGYLNQKAIQFSAVFMYALVLYGVIRLLSDRTGRGKRLASFGISAFIIASLCSIMWRSAYQAQNVLESKYVQGETFELGRSVLPSIAEKEVMVLDASFNASFFYGAWLPYAMEACRTSLPFSPNQTRWFHEPWPSRNQNAIPEFIVSSSSASNRLFIITERPIYENDLVAIHLNKLGQIDTKGLLLRHGNKIPIAEGGCEIVIGEGFGWTLKTEFVVNPSDQVCEFQVSNNGTISTIATKGGVFSFTTPLGQSGGSTFQIIDTSHCAEISFQEISFSKNYTTVHVGFNGLHEKEPDRVWMTGNASTRNDQSNTVWLNLCLIDRFHGLPRDSEVYLKTKIHDQTLSEEILRGGVSIEIPPHSQLMLKSTGGAISPAQIGDSGDTRLLSYAFSVFDMTTNPVFRTLDSPEPQTSSNATTK